MNWFMLANELIQHSRNTSIATAVESQNTFRIAKYMWRISQTGARTWSLEHCSRLRHEMEEEERQLDIISKETTAIIQY